MVSDGGEDGELRSAYIDIIEWLWYNNFITRCQYKEDFYENKG